jgi:perosamine synthetase
MEKISIAKPYFPKEDVEEIIKNVREIFETGMLMQGKFVEAFESEFAAVCGAKFGSAVNSCTSALQALLEYYDVRGKEVLVPVNTFLASANAVLFAGGKPVFVEMDPETLCLDVDDMKKRVTPNTKAVMVVHLSGLIPPRIEEIQEFCKEKGLILIEDASHAHGSEHNGKVAGSFGDAAAFSFLATKVITTGGEGGIVVTNDENLVRRVKSLRFHGEDKTRGVQDRIGNSWRMTEMQAIAGLVQARRLKEIAKRRMEIGQMYSKALSLLSKIKVIEVPDGDINAYYKYPLTLLPPLKRGEIKERLAEEFKIASGTSYWPPCHLQPAYKKEFGYKEGDYPVAEDVLNRTISLPMYCGLSDEEISRVINAVKNVCA